MAITHNFIEGWSNGSATLQKTIAMSADGENNRDIVLPDPSTNVLVAFVLDVSQLKSFFVLSDKAITIKTNSSGSPIETLTIAANDPFRWRLGCGLAIPFSVDITALYLTLVGVGEATVKIRCLVDATV